MNQFICVRQIINEIIYKLFIGISVGEELLPASFSGAFLRDFRLDVVNVELGSEFNGEVICVFDELLNCAQHHVESGDDLWSDVKRCKEKNLKFLNFTKVFLLRTFK